MKRYGKCLLTAAIALLIATTAISLLLVGCEREPIPTVSPLPTIVAQAGPSRFTYVNARRLLVSNEADFDCDVNMDANTLTVEDLVAEGDLTVGDDAEFADNVLVEGTFTTEEQGDFEDAAIMGDSIADLLLIEAAVRTYDGTDYIQDIDVGDVPGTANNGVQFAYNITDWDSETSFYALFTEAKIVTPTVISGVTMYGADHMVRLEGTSGGEGIYHAQNSTGIGMYAEVQAVYTSALETAYAVYGELEAGSGSTITDSSVFYADLVGSGTFGEVDVLSVRSGDTYDYGINFSPATAMTADIVFQNGTELEEVTDTVLTFSEFLAAEEQAVVVVGSGLSITPTGTYQPITSTAWVTTSTSCAIISGTVEGQLLILVNENASDAITIDDAANTRLSGDAVLGNDDTLMLIWDGADWLEIAQADNT